MKNGLSGLTNKLKEGLETLAGFRGPKGKHAVRFDDLEGVNTALGRTFKIAKKATDENIRLTNEIGTDAEPGTLRYRIAQALAEADAVGDAAAAAALAAANVRSDLETLTDGFVGTLQAEFAAVDLITDQVKQDITDLIAETDLISDEVAAINNSVSADLNTLFGNVTDLSVSIEDVTTNYDNALAGLNGDFTDQVARLDNFNEQLGLRDIEGVNLSQSISTMSQRLAWLMTKTSEIDSTFRDAGIYVSPEDGVVRIAAIDATEERISEAEIKVDAVEASINLRATTAYVNEMISNAVLDPTQIPIIDDLSLQISNVEIDLDALASTITSKADTTTVEGLAVSLSEASTTIDGLEGSIELLATKTEFSELETRTTQAETKLETIDGASITRTVQDVRGLFDSSSIAGATNLQALLDAYESREALSQQIAYATDDIRAKVEDDGTALASAITSLGVTSANSIAILEQQQSVTASEVAATAEQITGLKSEIDGVSANLTTNYLTSVEADEAIASAGLLLAAEVEEGITAELSNNYLTKTTTEEAIAASGTSLRASMSDFIGDQQDANLRDLLDAYGAREDQKLRFSYITDDLRAKVEEDDRALAEAVTSMGVAFDGNIAILEQQQRVYATELEAVAEQITEIGVGVDDFQANLEVNFITRADAESAIAASRTALKAEIVDGPIGDLSSTLTNDYYTKVGADEAISAAQTSLVAGLTGPEGAITNLSARLDTDYLTKVDTNAAISAATTALSATLTDPGGLLEGATESAVTAVTATLDADYLTKVDTNSAISAATTALSAELTGVDGPIAGISARLDTDYITKADTEEAISAARTSLAAELTNGAIKDAADAANDVSARLDNDFYTKVATDEAISSASTALSATLTGQDGPIEGAKNDAVTAVTATLDADYLTKVDTNSAISAATTALSAELTGEGGPIEAAESGAVATVSATLNADYLTKVETSAAIAGSAETITAEISSLRDDVPGYTFIFDRIESLSYSWRSSLAGIAALGQADIIQVREVTTPQFTTGATSAGASIKLDASWVTKFVNRRVKISVLARKSASSGADNFGVAYSTNDNGNSGVLPATGTFDNAWRWYNFYYDVPEPVSKRDHYIGIFGSLTGGNKTTDIARMTVQVASEADELPEISELSGAITEVKGLDIDALGGTAFGTMLSELSVAANGEIAGIKNFGTVMADLNEGVKAAYVLRAVAGDESGALEVVAYDDVTGTGSAITLDADYIFAKGTLNASLLAVGNAAQKLQNSDFSQGILNVAYRAGAIDGQLELNAPGTYMAGYNYRTLSVVSNHTAAQPNAFIGAVFAASDETGAIAGGYPIEGGEWHEFSVKLSADNCRAALAVEFYNASGALISQGTVAQNIEVPQGDSTNPQKWERYGDLIFAPAAAAFAVPIVYIDDATAAIAKLHIFQPFFAQTVADARLSPYGTGNTSLMTGDGLVTRSITSQKLAVEAVEAVNVNTQSFSTAGLALFGGSLQSDGFEVGQTGWIIRNDGTSEFEDVVIRRRLLIHEQLVNIPVIEVGLNTGTGALTSDEWAKISKTIFVDTSPIPIALWGGPDAIYEALVDFSQAGAVTARNSSIPDVYWGWTAQLLPLIRWTGDQSMRVKLDYWTRNVLRQGAGQLSLKIYKVT